MVTRRGLDLFMLPEVDIIALVRFEVANTTVHIEQETLLNIVACGHFYLPVR